LTFEKNNNNFQAAVDGYCNIWVNRRCTMNYDLAVIGAGPGGLLAAKRAAEGNLKVVVIERQRDVSKIMRACCQLFIMDKNYDKESIEVKEGKIIFPNNGFEVEYDGPTFNIMDMYWISPKGQHRVHFSNSDKTPSAINFDKGMLLKDLWEKCEKAGVEFRSGTVAYDAQDSAQGVAVSLTCGGAKSTLKAKKIIAADGVNSRIAEALGMNKERTLFATAPCLIYKLEGVGDFDGTFWRQFHMGQPYQSRMPVINYPSLEGGGVSDLVIMGSMAQSPEQVFSEIGTKGPLAKIFEKAKVVDKTGATVKAFTPMKVPYKGNALVISDAAAFIEVEVQGALMCGFHAASAVLKEMAGEGGFEQYTQWWQNSFEFHNEEELKKSMSTLLSATICTEDELDYLFSLTEDEVLEGSYSQWRQPKLVWASILRHRERIAKDMPELYEKIQQSYGKDFKELYSLSAPDCRQQDSP
jgi:flavin-dependent dehydrogenase